MRRAVAVVALALAGVGCRTPIHGGIYDDGDVPPPDMVRHFDFSTVIDMAEPVDLAQKSCGDIMKCAICSCGATPGQCQLQCFQNGSPTGVQEAGALFACIVQFCVLQDAGQGGLPLCIFNKCQMQLNMCQGLSLGC